MMEKQVVDIKRILVVEDEMTICEVCQRALAGRGYEIDIAVNGNVASQMLEGKHYELCLIDIRTLEMNGMQLYEFMKAKHPEMIEGVIFTTAYVLGAEVQRFLELAGRPFLPKPFTLEELRAIVSETFQSMEVDRKKVRNLKKGSITHC
jgi:DNA-binding NtrC family response regulator